MVRKRGRTWEKLLAVLLALLVWQAVAMAVGAEILLPTPLAVIGRFFSFLRRGGTWSALLYSASRILLGFLSGFLLGAVLSILAARFRVLETLLFPYMITVRAVPVASFTVVALIWLTAAELSGFISFLIVLPIVYNNILEGLVARDRALDEMADVFRLPFFKRLRYIWLPTVRPTLFAAATTAVGLAWKSGVAAELIGLADGTVGDAIYMTKINLDTPALFAFTLLIVLAGMASERLVRLALRALLGGDRA